MLSENLSNFIIKKHKALLIIPIIILIISLSIIYVNSTNKGYIINKDVSLAGGTSSTITLEDYDINEIESLLLENFPNSDISIRELSKLGTQQKTGLIIDITDVTSKELRPVLEENLNFQDISMQEIGPGLGQSFFREMIWAIVFAFILMAIAIFIIFRKLIPSLAVIFSAGLDLIATLAIISLFDIKLSTAGIAAFLMIIGYSVDTDVMLTTRLLKRREGELNERTLNALKTGLTMTVTTIVALSVGFVITNSLIIKQMFGIILIALVIDLVSTWVMNSSLLIWYIKKNDKTTA